MGVSECGADDRHAEHDDWGGLVVVWELIECT
jgi:hypothetical protein